MPENLNPEAVEAAADAVNELYADGYCPKAEDAAEVAVSAYFAACPSLRPGTLIRTVEELDQLPVGAVILDDIDDVMRYLPDGEGGQYWQRLGDEFFYSADEVDLPATVLWVPTEGGKE